MDYLGEAPSARLEVYEDHSREIVARNDSPDVGFSFSVNPYRGCMHACAYCYARPTHEYLSFRAGTDFETKIVVKPNAAELLRAAFDRPSWKGELLVFSGVTDCYQPLEASLKLTRHCLEVCVEYRNPVAIITKAPLIERDIDLLGQLARDARAHVSVSVPFWNQENARAIEPYVATPRRRMEIVERLAGAGVSVGVNVAPIIPGLNDQDIPSILKAARQAGATSAGYVLLRLPGSVKEVFEERLRATLPDRADRVLHRIRETRGGALYDSRFGVRGRGQGLYAEAIRSLFETTARTMGLQIGYGEEQPTTFRRPEPPSQQLNLL